MNSHIIFTYGNHSNVSVYLLSVFLTPPLLLSFCVERILSTWVVLPTTETKGSYPYSVVWLPYSAATSFFIFNPVAWNFFLTRNMWFRLEYSSIFLYLKNSLVNSIVYTVRMPEFVQEFSPLQLIATVFKITDTLHSNVTDPACFESKILVSVKLGRKLAYLRNSNKKSRVIF